MELTAGRIIFIIFFVLCFGAVMLWAYRADYRKQPRYFKGTIWVLATVLLILAFIYLFVRL